MSVSQDKKWTFFDEQEKFKKLLTDDVNETSESLEHTVLDLAADFAIDNEYDQMLNKVQQFDLASAQIISVLCKKINHQSTAMYSEAEDHNQNALRTSYTENPCVLSENSD